MKTLRGALMADPLIVLSTVFFGLISLTAALINKNSDIPTRAAHLWARFILTAGGVQVTVEGLERLQSGGSYVFAANHSSYMDTPVALAHIPVEFRFLAKHGLFQIPLLGTHLSQAGHIPVFRGDPRAAIKTLAMAAETIERKHISLLTFPEGGRSRDGALQNFKDGAAYIAIKAGVPLVPLVIKGARAVLPFGGGIVRSGAVNLEILEPIPTAGLSLRDRNALTKQTQEAIERRI